MMIIGSVSPALIQVISIVIIGAILYLLTKYGKSKNKWIYRNWLIELGSILLIGTLVLKLYASYAYDKVHNSIGPYWDGKYSKEEMILQISADYSLIAAMLGCALLICGVIVAKNKNNADR